jgi:hypothetical protein
MVPRSSPKRPASRQRTVLHGDTTLTASLIADLTREMITVGERTRDTDKLIEDRFRRHRHAQACAISLPGMPDESDRPFF